MGGGSSRTPTDTTMPFTGGVSENFSLKEIVTKPKEAVHLRKTVGNCQKVVACWGPVIKIAINSKNGVTNYSPKRIEGRESRTRISA